MQRGDIFWVDLGDPLGSEPGFRRPVLVIQDDKFNSSKIATVIVLSMTSNIAAKKFPGCVYLTSAETGLPNDSVANGTQIRTVEKDRLNEHVGQLDDATLFMVDNSLRMVLGL